jgi:hypothetical protein
VPQGAGKEIVMLDYPIKYKFIEETLKAAVSYLYEHSDKSKTCQDKADELMDGINTYMMKDLIVIRMGIPYEIAEENPVRYNKGMKKLGKKFKVDISNILFSDEAIEEWKKERRLNK